MKDEELNFIKRASQDADGFHFLPGKAPFEKMMATVICEGHQYIIREKTFKDIIYPLLLRKAIEGINKNKTERIINTDWNSIKTTTYPTRSEWKEFLYDYYDSIDTTIEETLKYIYEQELKQIAKNYGCDNPLSSQSYDHNKRFFNPK